MYTREGLLALSFMILLVIGCRKDQLDEQGPQITIIAPGNSTTLQIPDTLSVTIGVSDDRIVETVWITLGDINGVPIAPSATVSVNSSSAIFQREIIISNTSISSGSYSLSVRASDGTNTTSAFRSVNVQEAPLRLRSIFLASYSSGTITRIDSAGDQSVLATIADLGKIEINCFTQQMFVAAGPFDPLQVIALGDEASSWQLQNQNTGSGDHFTAIFTDPTDQRTYVSSNDGAIRAFDRNGVTQFNAQATTGYLPEEGVAIADKFISEQHAVPIGENRLTCYTYSSGDLLQTFSLDADADEMFALSDEQMLLFGDRNGEGVIQQWNILQGGNSDLRVFVEGPITAVAAISTTIYVVALPGRIIRYDQPTNTVTTLLNISANDVVYDRANGVILAAADQELFVIDPNSGAMVNTIEISDPIDRILPLFDR